MALITVTDGGGTAISQSLVVGFTSWTSDAINIWDKNKNGILTVEFSHTSATGTPKIEVQHSVSGSSFDTLTDINGNNVIITLDTGSGVTIANIIDCHTGWIKFKGNAVGSGGTLTGIKILAK